MGAAYCAGWARRRRSGVSVGSRRRKDPRSGHVGCRTDPTWTQGHACTPRTRSPLGRFAGVRRGQEERTIVTSVPTHFDGLPGSANSYVLLLLLRTLTQVEGLGPCHLLGRGSGIPPNYMDFGRLSAGRGSSIPPKSNGARVSYPPKCICIFIYTWTWPLVGG